MFVICEFAQRQRSVLLKWGVEMLSMHLCRIVAIVWYLGLLISVTSTGRAAEVGFVTGDGQLDKEFDIFWVDRLESQGHSVTLLPQTYSNSEAEDVELFIVSNDVSSADFAAGGGGAVKRLLTLNPVDLSGQTDVRLSLSLAARPTGWDEGIDFLTLSLDTNGNGDYDTQIADFQPFGGDLEDTISGQILSEFFEDLQIPISDSIDTLRLQINAFSTATGEQLGFDDIRVTGSGGTVIGTENFEGGAEQIGYITEGQGGANATFWDLSDAENVFPEIEFFDFEGDVWFGGADMDASFGGDGGAPHIVDSRPIITYEDALFDDLGLSAAGGRSDGEILEILEPDHPLAAGLSGEVEIYEAFQGITQIGDPLAEGTDVIAAHLDAPVIAVLEPGAEGLNGSPSPRRVISIFSHDAGFGDDYSESGLALLDASVAYALFGGADPGDFDGDGDLDVADVDGLIAEIVRGTNDGSYDVNNDAAVNADDLNVWVKDLKNTWFGDANLDGEFNSGDLVTVFAAGKYETDQSAGWGEGDWNADAMFSSGDLVVAFADGGYEQGPLPAAAAVPEPHAGILAVIGWILISIGCCQARQDR